MSLKKCDMGSDLPFYTAVVRLSTSSRLASPPIESVPLESDSLYQAPAVGASESGDAAARHDEVLYR